MAWTAPRTWVAGETLTAALLNTHLRDNLKALGDSWTAYTPTLTNWTLGNGTLTGSYIQVGKLVIGKVFFTVGSTTTVSGTLVISLPVTKVSDDALGTSLHGSAMLFDTSSSARAVRHVFQQSTAAMNFYDASGQVQNATNPWAWASGDKLNATFMYEAA
jgi:hypothetical protein